MYRDCFKRFLDLIISFIGLIIISPLLLVIITILHFTNKGAGVFFTQNRLGRGAETFNVLKFKTMTDECDPDGKLLSDAERVTKIGAILRRLKIDELPQLFNVFKGEMSLIGPRPALASQLIEYSDLAKMRLRVRPGMTGLAQIRGNIFLSWEERWEYDAEYVSEMSFVLDCRILCKTILVIIFGEEKLKKT